MHRIRSVHVPFAIATAACAASLVLCLLPVQAGNTGSSIHTTGRSNLPTKATTSAASLAACLQRVKANPKDATAQLQLGRAHAQLKHYKEAKSALAKSFALSLESKSLSGAAIAVQANQAMLSLPKQYLEPTSPEPESVAALLGGQCRGLGIDAAKPKILDFYADWCGPCKQMKPLVDKARAKYADQLEVVPLNVDDANAQELMTKYGVSALPTLVFCMPDGRMITYTVGTCGEDSVKWAIKELLRSQKEDSGSGG